MRPKATIAILSLILVALSGCGVKDDQDSTIASRVAHAASKSLVTTMSEPASKDSSADQAVETEPLRLASTRPNSILTDAEFESFPDFPDINVMATVEAADGARESMSVVGSFIVASVLTPPVSKPCPGSIQRLEIARVLDDLKKPCGCASMDMTSRT